MQRNKRSSYFEMKLAGSSIEKNRVIERLGAALANSINALKQLKSKIISNNDIMELPRLIVDFQKENANFNDLQKSLAEIDEDSTSMDKVRAFNAEFIEHYNPE